MEAMSPEVFVSDVKEMVDKILGIVFFRNVHVQFDPDGNRATLTIQDMHGNGWIIPVTVYHGYAMIDAGDGEYYPMNIDPLFCYLLKIAGRAMHTQTETQEVRDGLC